MPQIYRIKINKQLLGDYYPSRSRTRGTLVFLPGLPSYLHKSEFAAELSRLGYHVVQPFYYGSWVSGGDFNPQNCLKTVRDTITALRRGMIIDLYTKKKLQLHSPALYLGGISFGANVAQSFPHSPVIKKTLLISAVPVWKQPYLRQAGLNAIKFIAFLQRGFPHAYRARNWSEWKRELVGKGTAFNKFRAEPYRLIVFQGARDAVTPQLLKNSYREEGVAVNMRVISNAGHALDEYDQKRLAKLIDRFLRSPAID